jgi:putative hemolysin
MGMEFRGYDDDNVPIYVYVPDETDNIKETAEPEKIPMGIKIKSIEYPDVEDQDQDILSPYASFCLARGGIYDGASSTCKLSNGTTCGAEEYYYGSCGENKIPPTVAIGIALVVGILAAAVFLKD